MKHILHCMLITGVLATASGCAKSECGPLTKLPQEKYVLLHPDSAAFKTIPPDTFLVGLATSKGEVVIQVVRDWSPMGAFRFYNLVRNGYYDGGRFYRVIPGFVAQFGITGYPSVERKWANRKIPGDPIRVSNTRGMVTFAQAAKNSRTTQLFINLKDNPSLDGQKFAPIGRVISGMDVVDRLNGEYGEMQPEGRGPSWRCTYSAGKSYLKAEYPRLDSITRARLLESAGARAIE